MDDYQIKSIRDNLSRFKDIQPKKKRRGGLNEITDLRKQIADMLSISTARVAHMTKGWKIHDIFVLYKKSQNFVNPPALFWKLYRHEKNRRKDQEDLCRIWKDRGKHNKEEIRQKTLF